MAVSNEMMKDMYLSLIHISPDAKAFGERVAKEYGISMEAACLFGYDGVNWICLLYTSGLCPRLVDNFFKQFFQLGKSFLGIRCAYIDFHI